MNDNNSWITLADAPKMRKYTLIEATVSPLNSMEAIVGEPLGSNHEFILCRARDLHGINKRKSFPRISNDSSTFFHWRLK